MSNPPQTLSPQGEKVLIFGFIAGILAFLGLGFGLLGAPLPIAVLPFAVAVALIAITAGNVRHVRRHGWNGGADGPAGRGRREDPPEPTPPGPSGNGQPVDWDRFADQFWDHVERERSRVGA